MENMICRVDCGVVENYQLLALSHALINRGEYKQLGLVPVTLVKAHKHSKVTNSILILRKENYQLMNCQTLSPGADLHYSFQSASKRFETVVTTVGAQATLS